MSAVDIDTLKDLIVRALDDVKRQNGSNIELANDYFWSISPDALYQIYTEPVGRSITVGQVSESLDFVENISADDDVMPYSLVKIADVLRALGYELSGIVPEADNGANAPAPQSE